MVPSLILTVWIILYGIHQGWEAFLTYLNLRFNARHKEVPEEISNKIDNKTLITSQKYLKQQSNLSLLNGFIQSIITLTVILTGFFGTSFTLATRRAGGQFGKREGFLFLVLVWLVFYISPLPMYLGSSDWDCGSIPVWKCRWTCKSTSELIDLGIGYPYISNSFWWDNPDVIKAGGFCE